MGPVLLATGLVEPSPVGPVVEQVGWGVARQVARRLVEQVGERPLLARVAERAEAPGWAAYACFEGRDAVAVALLHLDPGSDPDRASYDGDVVTDDAPAGVREALLVRCLYDAAAAGARRLEVPAPGVGLDGWPVVNDQ